MEDISKAKKALTAMVDIGVLYESIVAKDHPNIQNDMSRYMCQQRMLIELSTKYNNTINTLMSTIGDIFGNALLECMECNNVCSMHSEKCENSTMPDIIAYRNKCISNSKKHYRLSHIIDVLNNKHQHGKSSLCAYVRDAHMSK